MVVSSVYFQETPSEIIYALRASSWDLQWVFHKTGRVSRHCYLFGDDGHELDPSDPDDLSVIHTLLPLLWSEYKACIAEIKHSHPVIARDLEKEDYSPYYLTYSKAILSDTIRNVID